MSSRQKRSQHFRFLFVAGVCGLAFAVCNGRSAAQTSEIDSYETAVKAAVASESKTEALNFIRDFASSHLVGDLIESLPPAVAREVCADLKGGGPAAARKACAALPQAVAALPVVPPAEIAPAAGSTALDPESPRANTPRGAANPASSAADASAGLSALSERKIAQSVDNSNTPSTDLYYLPDTETAPTAERVAADPVSPAAGTSAGVSPGDEGEGEQDAGATASTGLFHLPRAESASDADRTAVAAPVLAAADTPEAVSSGDEHPIEQDAGTTDEAGAAGIFYLPAAAAAPAAGMPESTTSALSDDESRGGHGNGDKDGVDMILEGASTVSTASIAAAPSVSTNTSASTGVPSVDEPDTSNAQSSTGQISNDQSGSTSIGSAKSGNAKSGKSKSGGTKSGNAQSSSDQSGSAESSSGQSSSGQSSGDQSGGTD
ncbi:MAG TPA: hypothetical protein VH835_01520, partial [Dongiaceae bacterium]